MDFQLIEALQDIARSFRSMAESQREIKQVLQSMDSYITIQVKDRVTVEVDNG